MSSVVNLTCLGFDQTGSETQVISPIKARGYGVTNGMTDLTRQHAAPSTTGIKIDFWLACLGGFVAMMQTPVSALIMSTPLGGDSFWQADRSWFVEIQIFRSSRSRFHSIMYCQPCQQHCSLSSLLTLMIRLYTKLYGVRSLRRYYWLLILRWSSSVIVEMLVLGASSTWFRLHLPTQKPPLRWLSLADPQMTDPERAWLSCWRLESISWWSGRGCD